MRHNRRWVIGAICTALLAVLLIVAIVVHVRRTRTASAADQFITLLNLGKSQYEQRQFDAAGKTFTQAIALRPDSLDAQLDLSNALLGDNKPEAAIQSGQAALQIDPTSAAAHYLLGSAYLRLARYEEALKSLQPAAQIDPRVAAVHFQIGLSHRGLDHLEEAASAFQETIDLEPEHPAAHYALGQALMQLGRRKRANQELERHREIAAKISGSAAGNVAVDASTFERSVYTQARVPFELAEEPDANGVHVTFTDATTTAGLASPYHAPVGILDVAHNRRPGLLVAEGDRGFRFMRNDNGVFAATGSVLPSTPGPWRQVLTGDLQASTDVQKPGVPGAIVLGDNGTAVFAFDLAGTGTDITRSSGLAESRGRAGVLADFDFTGHLGLWAANLDGSGLRTWRNQGNLTFKPLTENTGIPANFKGIQSLLVNDWNGDDLPDLFVARASQPPLLLRNQRGGPFTAAGSPVDWPAAGPAGAIAVADVDNDLHADLLVASPGQIEIVYGGGSSASRRINLPTGDFKVAALLAIDYDNDGWVDLIAAGDKGVRAWRNLGRAGFRETTSDLGLDRVVTAPVVALQTLDFNADGAPDLLLTLADGSLRLLQNQGASANHSITIALKGRRSNPAGLGSRIELTAGGWRTIREYDANPLLIGVGKHDRLDRLTVHWFDLAVSTADVPVPAAGKPIVIEELQLPTGSCPNLYAWDGSRYLFICDVLGSAPVGLPVIDGHYIDADTDELVGIGDDAHVKPHDGAYELQVTDELREVTYLDEAKLVVVDHPPGTEVVPTSKLLPGKPFPPATLVTLGNRRPLLKATRSDGVDMTSALRESDRIYASPVRLRPPQYRGLAEPWSVTLDFGPLPDERPLALSLSGWLRFGGGMANIAASHNPDLPFPFPTLEAQAADGSWHAVDVVVGAPSGKNKTILVDLTGHLPRGTRHLRLSTAFEIHWDRAALFEPLASTRERGVAGSHGGAISIETRLQPDMADLHWHGFGAYEDQPWFVPLTPDHEHIAQTPLWRITPSGWCTRYGDVATLLESTDDALVLLASGDEVTLRFAADRLPLKPAGWARDFFFFSSGWDKDADYHVARGETIGPLPFHGMDDQAYGGFSPTDRPEPPWARTYNTRWIAPLVLPRQAPPPARALTPSR